jgi:hypothetical protein
MLNKIISQPAASSFPAAKPLVSAVTVQSAVEQQQGLTSVQAGPDSQLFTDAAVTVEVAASPQGHRQQLHERVDSRLAELAAELERCQGDQAHSEHAQAITAAIQVAGSTMAGGWDRVGEQEAAQLAGWLTTTEDLQVTTPLLKAAESIVG